MQAAAERNKKHLYEQMFGIEVVASSPMMSPRQSRVGKPPINPSDDFNAIEDAAAKERAQLAIDRAKAIDKLRQQAQEQPYKAIVIPRYCCIICSLYSVLFIRLQRY